MADDHGRDVTADPEPNRGPVATRREFLRGASIVGASLLLPTGREILFPERARAASVPAGLSSVSSAMHIHGSFSELQGSWQSQMAEAARCGIDVLWPTDHDWRMSAYTYVTELHFKAGESSNGTPVTYTFSTSGKPASHKGELVASPVSPADPNGGALHVVVTGSGSAAAYQRCAIGPIDRVGSNLAGQRFTVRVQPRKSSRDAWLEILINLSYHTSFGGRPAGIYQLSYRIGAVQARRKINGIVGVVYVPAPVGSWSTVTLDPVSDIAALWPDLPDPRDNRIFGLWLGAGSVNSAPAEGFYSFGQFNRTLVTGNLPLDTQQSILGNLSSLYPSVTTHQGLEISFGGKHSNWFGGNMQIPKYPDVGTGSITAKSMQLIHSYGGLGSYNHPFGVNRLLASQATQDSARRAIAAKAINNHAYNADIIEVGYHQRGNASLETHQALWDTLSRNGIWLTGNGVSDNHVGTLLSWSDDKPHDTFATFIWAASQTESDLLAGLSAGRVFCGEIGIWNGDIWIDVDGAGMGSILVGTANSRQLNATVSGLGSSQVIEVVQGPVDYAGSSYPDPATTTRLLPAGTTTATIDTTTPCFVRINVLDQAVNRRIAFSNPVWLLRAAPPNGIPTARLP